MNQGSTAIPNFSIPVRINLNKPETRDIQRGSDIQTMIFPISGNQPFKNGTIETNSTHLAGYFQNQFDQDHNFYDSQLDVAQEPDANPITLPLSQISRIKTLLHLPEDSDITIYDGADLTPEIRFRTHIPSTKLFIMIKYIRPTTTRLTTAFLCKHEGCDKLFPKWHNLFDHLRIHTREKPFKCPVKGCKSVFNQTANQKKHVDTHREGLGLRLACASCGKIVQRQNLLLHYNMCSRMPQPQRAYCLTQQSMLECEGEMRAVNVENTPQFNMPP